MNEQRQSLTYSHKKALLLAMLIGAGLAGNFFAMRLFTGFNYLFGSIAVLLVVRLFGLRWGLLAGVVAASWTIRLFGHPYALVWLCGEPLFVGWLLKRGRTRNIILYDALYWPLLGAPLIWVFFQYVMHVPVLGTVAAMLMYSVIGITNALLASLLLTYVPRLTTYGEPEATHAIPIHHLIFNLMMAIVIIPAVIVMILHGKDAERRYLNDLYNSLGDSSRTALYEVRLNLQKRTFWDYEASAVRSSFFADLLAASRSRQHHHVTLLDSANRIISSTDSSRAAMQIYDPCPGGTMSKATANGIYRCLPNRTSPMPLWQRAQQSSYLLRTAVGNETPWNIVVETPFAPYQRLLLADHIRTLMVLLILNMLALMVSMYTSRRLAAPLRRLSQVTTDLPDRLLREKITSWPESRVTEIDQLIGNFREMAAAISLMFQEVYFANETLELHVDERTKELTRINEELQKEVAERQHTERQRDHLMEELVTQLRFLQTMIDAIPNPIFYKNANGLYQGCNRAYEECWGLSREDIVGKSVHDLFPPQAAAIFHKADQELFERQGVQIYETQTRYADSQTHEIIFYKATYDDSQGNLGGLVGTVVDISQRKKTEIERDQLMLELKQKNKELEGIVYVASHDLRSPLVNVQGFSRKLAKSCAELDTIISGPEMDETKRTLAETILRERIPKSLGFITSSIEKMDGLLSGLLRLSRLGRAALCFDTLDMQAILTKIVSSMTFQIETSGARVEFEHLDPCLGDSVQVNQVFSNLLDNAIKYRSPDRPLFVRISSEDSSEGIRYCVEDNGIGIPREQQDHIWDIFHRLNPGDTEGEGLGLTLAFRIVDRLGGSIWVESEPDIGSRFCVVLPRPPQAE